MITESDALRVALDEGARRWPALSRAQVLTRLVLEGARAARDGRDARRRRRIDALRTNRAAATGVYERGEIERLRAEWPE